MAAPKRISGTSQRIRSGWGNSANTALRVHLSWPLRSHLRSTWARVSSISLSYCTPDGQAVTQAMQPRQLSKWLDHRRRTARSSSSWPARMSTIRPRGESASSPHSW